MILYHTSNTEIPVPDIHHGRVNADFGQGFYLTPDQEFGYRWAWQDAILNRYELDMTRLRVRTFSRSTEWFEYIFHNRRGEDMIDADVVIGPIANDTIFETFGIIFSGFLKPEEALQLLMIGPEYTQVAVKTQKAADQLKWTGAEKITGVEAYKASLKKEQEAYQEQFATAMMNMGEDS